MMNKNTELIKNTAIIAFGRVCTQLINFFLLPVYTSLLSTSEYGTVDLVITYTSLFLPIVTLSLEQAVFRFLLDVRKTKEGKKEYISTCFFAVTFTLSILVFLLLFALVITRNSLFVYFVIILVASSISGLFLQICRGLGDNLGYSLGSIITAIVQILFNVLLLVVVRIGVSGMLLATCFGNVACCLFLFFRCKLWKYIHYKSFNKRYLKECLRYSVPMIPNQLSWWVLNASDKVIVQFFIGVAANGLIAVANKFSSIYMQFVNIFNLSWTESASLHIKDDDAKEFFTNIINSAINIALCACCGIIVCMPFVFPLLINPQYDEAYGLIPIFLAASFFNAFVGIYGVIYVAFKNTIEAMKTSIYAALINIISHLVLIKFVGIYAAALSTLVGFFILSVYRYFHSRKFIKVKLNNSTLVCGLFMLLVSFFSYYSRTLSLNIFAFVIVLFTSIFLNRQMLISILKIVRKR